LKWLDCQDNELSHLDVSDCVELEWLECQRNKLSILDVTNNTQLHHLNCSDNLLSTLDLSNNALLEGGLIVRFMPSLHEICVNESWQFFTDFTNLGCPFAYFTTDCNQ
jgi:Leucine-rich repeat (LRR) protein